MIVNFRRTGLSVLNGYNKSVKLELLSYFFFSVTFFHKKGNSHIGLRYTGPLDTQQRSSKTKLEAFVSCVLVEFCESGWQAHYISIQYATLRPRQSVFFFSLFCFFFFFFSNYFLSFHPTMYVCLYHCIVLNRYLYLLKFVLALH